MVLDIVEQDNFLLAREFISTLLSRLSGQDYVNVVAKNQVLLQSTCFDGNLARATPGNVAELERFVDDLGILIFSDLAGAFEGAVDMVADTRAREAGSLCEASVIVLTDRQEVDAADVADMRAAISKRSGAEVVAPDAAGDAGQHVFFVHFVAEEVPEDPVLDALSCIGSGVELQVRKRDTPPSRCSSPPTLSVRFNAPFLRSYTDFAAPILLRRFCCVCGPPVAPSALLPLL